jgi:hypothetical protein
MPWLVPAFPTLALPSPTILATLPSPTPVPITATPSITNTPMGGASATVTPGGFDSVNTLIAQNSALLNTMIAQSTAVISISGTPQSAAVLATQVGGNVGTLFGTIKGVQSATHNKTFAVISFMFLALMFVIIVMVLTTFPPMIIGFLRFIFEIIRTVKP